MKEKAEEVKKEKKEKVPMDKAKKKKIVKRSILGGVLLILVLFIVNSIMAAGKAKPVVYTQTAVSGDIKQIISTSGTVKTQQVETHYAKVAVPVGDVAVAVGDAVKEGQLLFSYDEEALNREIELAQLSDKASKGSYSSSVQKNNESLGDLHEANVNLAVLDQQIEDTEAYIADLEKKIEKKKSDIAYEGALLQISLLDWKNQPNSDEYMNLQKLVQINSYEQTNNEEIKKWNEELKTYNDILSGYKEYRSEMKSQKTSSDASKMNQGAKQELDATAKTKEIQNSQTLEDLMEAENGIKAEFTGVVTELNVKKGAATTVGGNLITLESTESVKVEISVSKYDLEKLKEGQIADVNIAGGIYEGEVSKISKIATPNSSGSPVVVTEISIKNPDENIFLGVEAKVQIHTNEAKGVIIVPFEAVNTDKDGDFIYTVENNVIVKKRVVAGISSDTMIEIAEGLAEGAQIVTGTLTDVEEGMEVLPIPEQ